MKQRVTIEDLDQLTDGRRKRLNELWIPELFQRAVAYICRDAEADEYEAYEFVIGGISLGQNGIGLTDVKALITKNTEEPSDDQFSSSEVAAYFSGGDDEEDDEDDETAPEALANMTFDFFNKEECLPLYTIGQLIETLQALDYGGGAFYINVDKVGEEAWVDRELPSTLGDAEYREAELCDALWAAVLETL
ncbi:MAG TPA: hypothetical protein VHR47_12745 [Bacillota bacterium]|nr:hypothetical protein [Bacillota bacterium]